MYQTLCVCALVPRLETRTRLLLVLHYAEVVKPTNTGQLAAQALSNSEIVVRGLPDQPPTAIAPDPSRQLLLLFPGEGAVSIADFARSELPITLVVPDGTWHQAGRVRKRVAGLATVPCVTLPPDRPTTYRLRSETQEGGLSTMEAIARAYGILEGETVQTQLEALFTIMVERTLWLRGKLRADEVSGGIPEAALLQRDSFNQPPRDGTRRARRATTSRS